MTKPAAMSPAWKSAPMWYGLLLVILCHLMVANVLGLNLLDPSVYDQYTLQAMTWRSGRIDLPEDIPYLEIARYNGRYFISFPPVPTIPMLLLSFVFGDRTPSMLVNMVYFALTYVTACAIARRYLDDRKAAAAAAFMVLGCNMLEVTLYGGVWNQAQGLSFLLTTLAVWGVASDTKRGVACGLICLALAVGCRPLQAFYVPLALLLLYRFKKGSLPGMIPYLIVPALIAAAYAVFNVIRFGNPLEFGHTYLPEFTNESAQFALRNIPVNLSNVLRLPWLEGNRLVFPKAGGFLFLLANPIFLLLFCEGARRGVTREWTAAFSLFLGLFAAHFLVLLTHRTFGGWQFGTRYLCDMVPLIFGFWLSAPKRGGRLFAWEPPVMMLAAAINGYGAIWFHMLS